MIAELGQFALVSCFVLALVQMGVAFCLPSSTQKSQSLRRLSYAQGLLAAGSFFALVTAFAVSDFSVLLVTEHSNSAKPYILKLAGTWGNHEGSILLWLLILAVFGAFGAASFNANGLGEKAEAWTLGAQATLVALFAAFVIWTSNPFERQFPVPLDGGDLNPLLQDIGLALHPPMLYVGYVGFSVVFAFAIGGLMSQRIDKVWAAAVRPFALAAWAFLTGGIALGSWWASYELGWGGWWFWDPVENLSLMPWLTGTALIHSLLALGKRETLRAWTVFLALITFSASMLGTLVVRSGILTSVHSFAVDPARGSVILAITVFCVGAALIIFWRQAPRLADGNAYGIKTRENAIVVNNLLLCSAFGAVFVGTFYPVIAEMTGGGRPSVGAPFYAATFNPMMLLLMVLMAIGPLLMWKVELKWRRLKPFVLPLIPGGVIAALVFGLGFFQATPLGLAAIAVAGSVATGGVVSLLRDKKMMGGWDKLPAERWGMPLAHVGLAVSVVGMVGASLWVDEYLVALSPGEETALGDSGWHVQMGGLEVVERGNHVASIVPLTLTRGALRLALSPERRQYTVRQEATTELDTARSLGVNLGLTDVFATLGQPTRTGRMVAKVVFRPLQVFLWLGAILMFFGGAMSWVTAIRPRQGTTKGRSRQGQGQGQEAARP